jgi:F0F1-type ATP synthase epsilon subunit
VYFVLDFGMAEVLPHKVTVLVRLADKIEEIDVQKQEAERKAAESELQSAVSLEDAERARLAMLTAMMKLRAAERARMKRL